VGGTEGEEIPQERSKGNVHERRNPIGLEVQEELKKRGKHFPPRKREGKPFFTGSYT